MTILMSSIRTAFVIGVCLSLGSTRLLGDEEREAYRLINDCGVNSLYLLLRLRSAEGDLADLRRSLPDTKPHGLSIAEIQATAEHHGVSLRGRRIGLGDVPIDRPVIAFLKRGEDQGHFVVLEPVGNMGKMVMVLDFPRPARIVADKDLMNGDNWTGLVLTPVTTWERFGPWIASSLGVYGSLVAGNLFSHLDHKVRQDQLGRVVFETLFRIGERNDRRPDLAFISSDRWKRKWPSPGTNAWDVVPDLMIEVVSKTDRAWEVLAKVRQYFDAGARAVWLVYPNLSLIHCYESFDRIKVLTRGDELDGGQLFPGFRLRLDSFFEEAEDDGPEVAD